MTQALTVSRSLSRRGHEVVGVVVGAAGRPLPSLFTSALPVPPISLPSPGFVVRGGRSLDLAATAASVIANLGTTLASVRRLRAIAQSLAPDLVINFFEPLTGLAQMIRPLPCPVASVAHQFMFLHPAYQWQPGIGWQRLGRRAFVRLVGWRSVKLALTLEPAPDLDDWLVVGPPLLRQELLGLEPRSGDDYLVYLLNHGYAEDLRAWHRAHPEVVLHCFYDRPGAPEAQVVAPNLTFHRLNGSKFIALMAGCRAVVGTAGFESVSEAAWLGKPVFLVPVDGHLEQALNAAEAARLGLGIADSGFHLDRLGELPSTVANAGFRQLGRPRRRAPRPAGSVGDESRRLRAPRPGRAVIAPGVAEHAPSPGHPATVSER